MRKLEEAQGLNQLIEAGSTGYFPLFYPNWITDSFKDQPTAQKMTFSRAAETVHRVYKRIERHHTIERKKTAIQALNNEERQEFILSFMKMVEYRALDKLRELH